MAQKPQRIYTDLQLAFLDALRDPTNKGDLRECMRLAGYNNGNYQNIKTLTDEIVEIAKDLMAQHSVRATFEMIGVLDNPGLNSKNIIAAAKEILDRANVKKTEEVNLKVGSGILILPAKESTKAENEPTEG